MIFYFFFLLRKTTTSTAATLPRLTLNELKDFVTQVHNLPCTIKETNAIDKLMAQVESFRYDARIVLTAEGYNEKKVVELLEHAEAMDVDLPEINDLRLVKVLNILLLRNILDKWHFTGLNELSPLIQLGLISKSRFL